MREREREVDRKRERDEKEDDITYGFHITYGLYRRLESKKMVYLQLEIL